MQTIQVKNLVYWLLPLPGDRSIPGTNQSCVRVIWRIHKICYLTLFSNLVWYLLRLEGIFFPNSKFEVAFLDYLKIKESSKQKVFLGKIFRRISWKIVWLVEVLRMRTKVFVSKLSSFNESGRRNVAFP